jgi:hypothetical protein
MHSIQNKNSSTDACLRQIQFLVEQRNANVNLLDAKQANVLHYLAQVHTNKYKTFECY